MFKTINTPEDKQNNITVILASQCSSAIKEIIPELSNYVNNNVSTQKKRKAIKNILMSHSADAIEIIAPKLSDYVHSDLSVQEKRQAIRDILASQRSDAIAVVISDLADYVSSSASPVQKRKAIHTILSSQRSEAIKTIIAELPAYLHNSLLGEKPYAIKAILASQCPDAIKIIIPELPIFVKIGEEKDRRKAFKSICASRNPKAIKEIILEIPAFVNSGSLTGRYEAIQAILMSRCSAAMKVIIADLKNCIDEVNDSAKDTLITATINQRYCSNITNALHDHIIDGQKCFQWFFMRNPDPRNSLILLLNSCLEREKKISFFENNVSLTDFNALLKQKTGNKLLLRDIKQRLVHNYKKQRFLNSANHSVLNNAFIAYNSSAVMQNQVTGNSAQESYEEIMAFATSLPDELLNYPSGYLSADSDLSQDSDFTINNSSLSTDPPIFAEGYGESMESFPLISQNLFFTSNPIIDNCNQRDNEEIMNKIIALGALLPDELLNYPNRDLNNTHSSSDNNANHDPGAFEISALTSQITLRRKYQFFTSNEENKIEDQPVQIFASLV